MISECISDENFEFGYSHSNALLQFRFELECCKSHNAANYPTKCDVINDVKLLSTVYRRIYCHKFFTLSNQKSHYKSKFIRIPYLIYTFISYSVRRDLKGSITLKATSKIV